MTRQYRLDLRPENWVLLGYIFGLLVWWLLDATLGSGQDTDADRHTQTAMLSEDHLTRLEGGESVVIRRWHGHDLVIDGSLVVDVTDEGGGE